MNDEPLMDAVDAFLLAMFLIHLTGLIAFLLIEVMG